jgi:hypothetical protein
MIKTFGTGSDYWNETTTKPSVAYNGEGVVWILSVPGQLFVVES